MPKNLLLLNRSLERLPDEREILRLKADGICCD